MMRGPGEESQKHTSILPRILSWAPTAPILLTLVGILVYGIFANAYSRFYGELGLPPEDVGLNYIGTLSRSVGLLFAVLGYAALIGIYLAVRMIADGVPDSSSIVDERSEMDSRGSEGRTWYPDKPTRAEEKEEDNGERGSMEMRLAEELALLVIRFIRWLLRIPGLPVLLSIILMSGSLNLAATKLADGAHVRAEAVAEGRAVAPWKIGAFDLLAIRADPVDIVWEPSKSTTGAPTTGLYLGQSNGIAIVYDAANGEVLRIPSDWAVLHIKNCDRPINSSSCINRITK
jgi:hypothetical protein